MNGSIDTFRQVIEQAGLVPGEIVPDGALHRCPVTAKPQGKDGAYIFHPDPPVSGWFQNWRGESPPQTWTAENQENMTPEEREKLKARIQADKKARAKAQAERYAEARDKAAQIAASCVSATAEYPYLQRKGVKACAGLLQSQDGKLVVPVLGPDGKPQSLQFIDQDGNKLFLSGGKIGGGYFPIKGKDGSLYVAEGLATGLSVHEATEQTVLTAFNAGNLRAVAEYARKLYPNREIIIAADNDLETDGNPGVTKAKHAAEAVGGKVAVPVHPEDSGKRVDFNDLHTVAGLEAVQEQLGQVQEMAPATERYFPFRVSASGVYYMETNSEGDTTPEWLCSSLRVVALARDSESQEWGRVLEMVDADGVVKRWTMPMSMLAGVGDGYRSELLSMGVEIAPGTKAKNHLHLYLSLSRPEARARCVSRIGWHGKAFVLPDCVIGPQDGEETVLQGGPRAHAFKVSGTLEDWQREVGALCVGNSRLLLAASCALAGSVIYLVGAESGGLHFVGGSSEGKTTALRVAGSVCGGGGIRGFIDSWRATDNALESVAAHHCDTCLCLDELSQADSKSAGETAYMLANGQGKSRSRRDGTGRPPQEWRVLFLSTGEVTLSDKMREDRRGGRHMAGQAVRVVDIPADAGAGLGLFECIHGSKGGAAFSDRLRESTESYYGSPLRAFLEKLIPKTKDVAGMISGFVKEFVESYCPAGADGQVNRVCTRFGLVAAAGELGVSFGVLPWPKHAARDAAVSCFRAWLDRRGGVEPAEIQEGIALIRAFFQANGTSRFENLDSDHDQKIINRAGYRQRVHGETRFCVFPDIFAREICAGINSKQMLQELSRRKILLHENGRWTRNVRTPDGSKKLHIFLSSILDDFTGNTGNTGNMPENTDETLFPSDQERVGTLGTEIAQSPPVPICSQCVPSDREHVKDNDSNVVPTAPSVPTEKGENWNNRGNDAGMWTGPAEVEL